MDIIIPWLTESQRTLDKLRWNLLLRAAYILCHERVLYCTLLHDLYGYMIYYALCPALSEFDLMVSWPLVYLPVLLEPHWVSNSFHEFCFPYRGENVRVGVEKA